MMRGLIFFQIFIAQAKFFHRAGVIVFHHDIRFRDQLARQVRAARIFQVEHDAFFVRADP